jgi:hypothetical protein
MDKDGIIDKVIADKLETITILNKVEIHSVYLFKSLRAVKNY